MGRAPPSDGREMRTDAEGRFTFDRVAAGAFELRGMWRSLFRGLTVVIANDKSVVELPPIRVRKPQIPNDEQGWCGFSVDWPSELGRLVVTEVFPDTPADRAGMRPGDVITHVRGNDVTGFQHYLFWTFIENRIGDRVAVQLEDGRRLEMITIP